MTSHVAPGGPRYSVAPYLEPLEVRANAARRQTDQRQPHETGTPGPDQLRERPQDAGKAGGQEGQSPAVDHRPLCVAAQERASRRQVR